ncbi:hypothetical protein CPB83DRAFT_885624 [Crepidotus variabilis]|uniref:Uncharacterized protein n=1 Tax=Crepidotus variabilis TaxID=179855 RepID=A0A9P6EA99_9AGAR|nr:hypothetical protein CPB83DRAFT_885624 [Crepidotus variabilis]
MDPLVVVVDRRIESIWSDVVESSSLSAQKVDDLARFLTSSSTASLDIGQVTGAITSNSLLCESVTLSTLSTKSSESVPIFGASLNIPLITSVALGEDLKMFSAIFTHNDETPGLSVGSRVMLAAPTIPRLKTMCKECLCINKWAQHSTSWKAPGHIPWESAEEGSDTTWIPEGSLFTPESFSRTLSQIRGCEAEEGYTFEPDKDSELMHQSHMDSELVKMVDELKGLRTFFESPIDEGTSAVIPPPLKQSIPSLVVSNSHSTFPLSLHSSRTLEQPLIASRRRKGPPPPLFLHKSVPMTDIPYPDIPTAFLGSSSSENPKYSGCDDDQLEIYVEEKPAMRVEDMINNLRMQCLTMSLPSPPPDSSLNSRSAVETTREPTITKTNNLKLPRTAKKRRESAVLLARNQKNPSPTVPEKKTKTISGTDASPAQVHSKVPSAPMPLIRKATNPVRNEVLQIRSPPVRSFPKSRASGPSPLAKVQEKNKKSCKTVRFALTSVELQEETSLVKAKVTSRQRVVQTVRKWPGRGDKMALKFLQTPHGDFESALDRSVGKAPSTREPTSKNDSPIQVRKRAHALKVTPVHRHSDPLTKVSFDTEKFQVDDETAKANTNLRHSNTLGRRSLSRIIRGPMQALKESRRATISISTAFETKYDENAVRRQEFGESKPNLKKSRLPTPLRSILTRLK